MPKKSVGADVVVGGEFIYPNTDEKDPKTNKPIKAKKPYFPLSRKTKTGDDFTIYRMVLRVEDLSTSTKDKVEFLTIETGSLELAQSVKLGQNYEVMGSLKIGRKEDRTYISVRPQTITPTGN
jgi:hypothetical protein